MISQPNFISVQFQTELAGSEKKQSTPMSRLTKLSKGRLPGYSALYFCSSFPFKVRRKRCRVAGTKNRKPIYVCSRGRQRQPDNHGHTWTLARDARLFLFMQGNRWQSRACFRPAVSYATGNITVSSFEVRKTCSASEREGPPLWDPPKSQTETIQATGKERELFANAARFNERDRRDASWTAERDTLPSSGRPCIALRAHIAPQVASEKRGIYISPAPGPRHNNRWRTRVTSFSPHRQRAHLFGQTFSLRRRGR